MYYTVYKITNLVNGKIYVGIHKTNDLDDGYMGSGKILKRALVKYGIENFKKEYLEVFDNPEDMFHMESKVVNEDFVNDEQTYNLKVGGDGGFDYINSNGLTAKGMMGKKHNEETKKKMSDNCAMKREEVIRRSVAARKLLDLKPFLNKKHTKETKKKMSESSKGMGVGKTNSQYGTCWIHHVELKQNKKIKKEDLDSFVSEGWIKGRKMKF